MKLTSQLTLAALAASSLISFSANSAIINFTFEGTTVNTCTTCIAAGTDVTATYTLDTNNAIDVDGELFLQTASYTLNGNTFTMDNSLPSESVSSRGGEVFEFNSDSIDVFSAYNQFYGDVSYDNFGPITSDSFNWFSYDTRNSYTGDFSVSGGFFGNARIELFGAGAFIAGYEAHSFSVNTVSAVPVPAAAWLFASGLIGLAGVSRRKNTSK